MTNPYIWGTGRRKRAVARVRIKTGTGVFMINGKPFDQFFTTHDTRSIATKALTSTESTSSYDVHVSVAGGGPIGQAGAVSLGIARALKGDNPNFEPNLRENGLLTRDSRKVERKKYGRRKARRSTQFSKR